ncbi:MAG: PDZ domain-containing protein, partial [Bacteroidota bacterium]
MKHSIKVALPLLILSSLAIGIWVGSSWFALSHPMQHNTPPPPAASGKRLNEILSYIDLYYVDSVDADSLTEAAIELIVNQLDPHTAYIPARELELVEAGLNADFEGVGIEFNLIRDTIYVVSPVEGGPSERVGIQAGDQIVVVEGDTIAGKGISNREVIETLRGKKGSKVTVGVRRKGEPELLSFTITRDKIPNHAI